MVTFFAIGYYFAHLSGIFGGCVLALVNHRKERQTHIQFLHLMTMVIVNYVMVNILLLLPNFMQMDNSTVMIVGSFTIVLMASNIGFLIFFFEIFSGDVKVWRLSHGVISITGVFTLMLASYFFGDFSLMHTPVVREGVLIFLWSPFSYLFMVPQITLLATWTLRELRTSIKETKSYRHRNQLKLMARGVATAFLVGPLLSFMGDAISLYFSAEVGLWISEFAGFLFMSLGIAFILLSYALDNSLLFLQPNKVERLLVIHESGMPLFDYEFKAFQNDDVNEMMLSGLILAIKTVASEVLGKNGILEEIKFRGMEILLLVHEEIIFMLIAQKRSSFLRSALRKFSQAFIAEFGNTLTSYEIDQKKYTVISWELEKNFGLIS
ncbi:MAG: hypothetical protein D6732_12830 [Methanobacteriota archaeon]|nr:MAG: hypothetical protein D6732_12830 [Euryarchaeota archaeon]